MVKDPQPSQTKLQPNTLYINFSYWPNNIPMALTSMWPGVWLGLLYVLTVIACSSWTTLDEDQTQLFRCPIHISHESIEDTGAGNCWLTRSYQEIIGPTGWNGLKVSLLYHYSIHFVDLWGIQAKNDRSRLSSSSTYTINVNVVTAYDLMSDGVIGVCVQIKFADIQTVMSLACVTS